MARRGIRDVGGRLCVVTGAASGIGRATAVRLATQGARLVVTDLDAEGLERTAGMCRDLDAEVLSAEALDLAEHGAVEAFGSQIVAEHGAPEAVFHVAGVSAWGRPDLLDHGRWTRMVDVNLMGTIHVVEAFVPAMMRAGRPAAIAFVSSAAGLLGLPWHAAYSAAKFGVRGIAEVLRFDLESYGISVHLVCPGAVDTPLVHTVDIAGVDRDDPEVRRAAAQFRRHAVSADHAASAMVDGVLRGRYLVFTSPDIRLAHLAQRYVPPVYAAAMRVLQRRIRRAAPGIVA